MPDIFTARVLRANVVGFTAGCRLLLRDVPRFGDLVKTRAQEGFTIFGLIYDIRIGDDPVVRQLILVGELEPELILDQQQNRLVPIEIGILSVGYQDHNQEVVQGLPPQPPPNLDLLVVCDEAELQTFTASLNYLRLILNAAQMPADELLATNLVRAGLARAPEDRYRFLMEAGRELARLLGHDLIRLDGVLRRIRSAI